MTQEQKELLLKDICARLPYGVIALTEKGKGHICDINLTIFGTEIGVNTNPCIRDTFVIEDIKPYLFPLSSLTEEQRKEYDKIIYHSVELHCERYYDVIDVDYCDELQDFYHKNHFDYRGLIPMGLAMDATGLNIYE